MYSVIVNGKVLDFKYRKQHKGVTAFYIGDILIGQIFKVGSKYSVVVWHNIPNSAAFRHVRGFATRYDASEYMLRACGYHDNVFMTEGTT